MLKSVNSVSYSAADIEAAKKWYSGILGLEPFFDSPFLVVFKIGEITLSIVKTDETNEKSNNTRLVYWAVDNIDSAYKKLLECGAKPVTEISIYFDSRNAKIEDPFGNVFGIRCKETKSDKSLDDRPSDTAMTVAFCRAYSNVEEREEIRGADYLAELFLNEESLKSIKDPVVKNWMKNNLMTDGSYEFLVSRTAYFDNVFKQALNDNIPQIVFLGAGYDSRSFRFENLIKDTNIFELDVKSTQQRKIEVLKKNNISIPNGFKFVEIDFTKDSIVDVLNAAGYSSIKQTLFIWEGVTYYLPRKTIDETFNFVKNNSTSGSILCFDYILTTADMENKYKAKEVLKTMKERYSAEQIQGCFKDDEFESYLNKQGFLLVENLSPEEMEKRYLTFKNGSLAGKITGVFYLAKTAII